jgi:hypothetical protein
VWSGDANAGTAVNAVVAEAMTAARTKERFFNMTVLEVRVLTGQI